MGVTFKFTLNQNVKLLDTCVDGKVDSLMVDRDRVQWVLLAHVDAHKVIRTKWIREGDLETIYPETGE